ncbi:MAG: T9SS type A sorting domain-containing protein [Chitinophagaceae bacterium]|nr:T9SS type A sorting domain-containing protein [Chitinophagaceae bacterium]
MAGTLHQHIKGKGTWSGSIRLQIENPNHVTTDDTLWLPADLELAAGKIIVSENALLGMSAESQINYTPENFIEGSLALCGESMLQFPVGAGGIFAPLQVSAGGNRTDTFIAKYFRGNPQSTAGIAGPVASPIENLSAVEYWKLESQTTAARKISLFAGLTSFVQNPETMLVAGNEGGQWVSRGLSLFESTAQQSPWVCGFVHAEEASTAYSWFTLASKDGNPVNPLPVKLMSFATRMLYDGILQISWLCSEDVAPGTRFRLYRNEAGQRELILDSITGSGTPSRQFYYLHQLSNPGHYTFYLEMVDPVYGKQVSALRTVQWLPYATAFINVFPNPATTRLWLRWESGPQPFYLRIINSMGQTISLKKMAGSMGVRDYLVDVSKLPAGWYRFEVSRGNIPLAVCSVVVRR